MGSHSQNVVPGTDNTYDLGTSSARWKDLFLRHGAKLYDASSNIWELDYRGIVRDKFAGEAELTDDDLADIGTPDSLAVQFMPGETGLGDDNFRVHVTGQGAILVTHPLDPNKKWRVYAFWHAPYPIVGAYHNTFTCWVTFTAYKESDNTFVTTTNNWKAMAGALTVPESLPANLGRVQWIVTWPL